ncbi:MAG: hypothetical protein PHH13_05290 [Candidatus Peribacteraceae bacterium]|nr:hypothetical protein [Candidatus Peribacteraceae bacterium]
MKIALRLALTLSLFAGTQSLLAYMTPDEVFRIEMEVIAPSILTAQAASSDRTFFRNGQPVDTYTPPIPSEPSAPTSEEVSSSSESTLHEAAPTETGAVNTANTSGATLSDLEIPTDQSGTASETVTTGSGFSALSILTALPLWQIILIAVALVAVPFLLFSRRRKKTAPTISDTQPLGAPVVAQPLEDSSARLEQALKSLETSTPQVPVSSPADLAVLPPKESSPSLPAQPSEQQTTLTQPATQPAVPTELPAAPQATQQAKEPEPSVLPVTSTDPGIVPLQP